MLKKYLVPLVITFTISLQIVTAQVTNAPVRAETPLQSIPITRNDINLIIERNAFVYGISSDVMKSIIHCESRYKTDAVNISPKEESYGLVQINLIAHNYTIEQAQDPEFAISFLAKHLASGKASKMWYTCYKYATL